ncbi:MAG: UDP-3-O-(3-hydroxymyristoyl)glucosamine N-acyltransferase [Chthoniobacterales bacterium]|nr:UDP-3-O-(3-hydroxymyristoyl)glucosamine N-acyltransferase [Chthoniobacterales bacterium]
MNLKLQELAKMCGGSIAGEAGCEITGAASLAEATPGEITFYGNPRYLAAFRKTRASAAFVPLDFEEQIVSSQIRVEDPTKAFEQVVLRFAPRPITFPAGVHPSAVIAPEASLGKDVSIGACVVVEAGSRIGDGTRLGAHSYIGHETTIGSGCLIYPNVTIRERTRIGERVIIHSGTVIGSDGFGFEMAAGGHKKVPQIGIVQIDNDVEIGANTTIDRARFGRTWIQEGVKIDNLVQIAHNVVIGKHSIIVAQVGIAGSVRIGSGVVIGGQAGIIGHIEIDDGTLIGAQSGVSKSLHGGTWWATPTVPLKEAKQQLAWVRRLGKLFERVKALEERSGENP